jgi:hypothetical protein
VKTKLHLTKTNLVLRWTSCQGSAPSPLLVDDRGGCELLDDEVEVVVTVVVVRVEVEIASLKSTDFKQLVSAVFPSKDTTEHNK